MALVAVLMLLVISGLRHRNSRLISDAPRAVNRRVQLPREPRHLNPVAHRIGNGRIAAHLSNRPARISRPRPSHRPGPFGVGPRITRLHRQNPLERD